MTSLDKFHKIINWFSQHNQEETKTLAEQKDFSRIEKVEKLVGESLPLEVRDLFEKYDGDEGSGYGVFFGHSLAGLTEIINSLSFAKTQVKPDYPTISNPQESEKLVDKIIEVYIREIPVKKKLGIFKQQWHKLGFECSPGSMGGPYLYREQSTTDREREIIRLSDTADEEITDLVKKLHDLEVEHYNWDNLEVAVYGNGQKEVNRTFYDFDNTLPLTSSPEGAIKKKYFHVKWLPLISDYGGNYIGIDLDPDSNGKKGQVIVFGRDEEDMFVIANSWEEFLELNLELIGKGGEQFLTPTHLHEIYRALILPNNNV